MSCSKEEDNPTDEGQEIVLSLVSSKVLPGDAVQITSSHAIPLGEIEVLLNDKTIKAYSIDNYNYVFVLPVVNSGDYTLKVPVNEKKFRI